MKTLRKELVTFFLISFGWMWVLNAPRVMASYGLISIPPLLSTLLGYLAVFGPGIAAFILTRIQSDKEGCKSLWKRGWGMNFPKKWLAPAFLLMPAMGILTYLLMRLFKQAIPWEYGLPPAMMIPIGLLIWFLGALPEEYGWRGYALPRLLDEHSPLVASLILGLIWGVWHLPLHFISSSTQYVIPIWQYILQTVLLSVLYTWIYRGTGGSILIAGVFHAMGNITGAVFPYWTTEVGRWISFGLLLIPVILIVFKMQTSEVEGKKIKGR
jgi:membrane protease YdiL (CAAX protease family)